MANYKEYNKITDNAKLQVNFLRGPSPAVVAKKTLFYPTQDANIKQRMPKGCPEPRYLKTSGNSKVNAIEIIHFYENAGYTIWEIQFPQELTDEEVKKMGDAFRGFITKGTYPKFIHALESFLVNGFKITSATTYLNDDYKKEPLWLGWCNWGVSVENEVVDLNIGSVINNTGEFFYKFVLNDNIDKLDLRVDSGLEDSYIDFEKVCAFLKKTTSPFKGQGFTEMKGMDILF